MKEVSDRQRKEELLELAQMYLPTTLCLGQHLVHSGYVCPWCDSNNPRTICFKEKLRSKEERPTDYTDPTTRAVVRTFEVTP